CRPHGSVHRARESSEIVGGAVASPVSGRESQPPKIAPGRIRGHPSSRDIMNRLAGKRVLITGASSGFGAAAARRFAEHGSNLLLSARRVDRVEDLAAEIRKE